VSRRPPPRNPSHLAIQRQQQAERAEEEQRQAQIDQYEADLDYYQESYQELQDANAALEDAHAQLEAQRDELQKSSVALKAENVKLTTSHNSNAIELATLQAQVGVKTAEVESMRAQFMTMMQEKSAVDMELYKIKVGSDFDVPLLVPIIMCMSIF